MDNTFQRIQAEGYIQLSQFSQAGISRFLPYRGRFSHSGDYLSVNGRIVGNTYCNAFVCLYFCGYGYYSGIAFPQLAVKKFVDFKRKERENREETQVANKKKQAPQTIK